MVRRQLGAAAAVVAVASLVYAGGVVRDGATEAPERKREQTAAATTAAVRLLDWNVCGEAGSCPSSTLAGKPAPEVQQEQLAARVADLVTKKNAEAVFLQEVCGDDAKNDRTYDSKQTDKSLLTWVGDKLNAGKTGADRWDIAFVPYTRPAENRFGTEVPVAAYPTASKPTVNPEYPPRYANPAATSDFRCRGPYKVGVQGMAIAVKGTLAADKREEYELDSPDAGLWLKVLCVTRATGAQVRLCTSHLTPKAEDRDHRATYSHRAAQVQRLTEIVGDGADTVFGGDFNSRPPADNDSIDKDTLAPLYTRYRECEQLTSGTAYKGSGTMWDYTNPQSPVRSTRKYDYLFSKGSFSACEVVTDPALALWSDHLPVVGTVQVTVA
ncbi:endonuclease/exonuclease/phosphatase family protein [Streptomyces sp. YH02]|uniref:endonuclease/exonuclease/phosphatase family protein n=1 Tax=Streptomyces sp. YH02 TaxID=3256999 RepID=UPI003757473E